METTHEYLFKPFWAKIMERKCKRNIKLHIVNINLSLENKHCYIRFKSSLKKDLLFADWHILEHVFGHFPVLVVGHLLPHLVDHLHLVLEGLLARHKL